MADTERHVLIMTEDEWKDLQQVVWLDALKMDRYTLWDIVNDDQT
jgi:hypothetical protein